MDHWVIIRTPDGVHCYELGDVDAAELSGRVNELRTALGVPADSDPFDASTWDVQVSDGEPHPNLLAQAVAVHRLGTRDRVEPGGGLEGPRPRPTGLPTAEPDQARPLMPHELLAADLLAAAEGRA